MRNGTLPQEGWKMDTCRCVIAILMKHLLMSDNGLLLIPSILGFQYTSIKYGGIFR
jgi:hypothetical protein